MILRWSRLLADKIPRIRHYADNHFRLSIRKLQMLADRVFTRIEPLCQRLADDNFVSLVQTLTLIERPSAQYRNPERAEIASVCKAHDCGTTLADWLRRMFRNRESPITPIAAARHYRFERRSLHAGRRSNSCKQCVVKIYAHLRRAVSRVRQSNPHGKHVVRDATNIGRTQSLITANQQPCSNQQHYREPDFN